MNQAPPLRPGIASTRWPGTIHELLASGDLPPDTPGLAQLEEEMPAGWHTIEAFGERLDQRGWPLRHDVDLACRACLREPSMPPHARAWLSAIRGWLDGTLATAGLESTRRESIAVHWGIALCDPKQSDDDALGIFDALCQGATSDDRTKFLDARRHPPVDSIAWLAVECASAAAAGWLAYHAHRGTLPMPPIHAAEAIRAVVRSGALSWLEVVDWARQLVRSKSQARPRVLVLSKPQDSEFAQELQAQLTFHGCDCECAVVKEFPIADGLAAMLGKLSDQHGVVMIVIGAMGAREVWVIRECSIRNLYPNVFAALAPGVQVPDGWKPLPGHIIESGGDLIGAVRVGMAGR